MCLNPIRIVNPKHKISLSGGTPYYIEVPCGECAECKKISRDEWYFRTYYEAQSCFDSNGYILFDTLTYKDSCLPHMSDYCEVDEKYDCSCFNTEDYRNFFAQLREEWHRLYMKGLVRGDSKGNLKYFLTSEYGTSESGTHRPHYHVLFFVRNNAIDWFTLSKLISKCWHRGRTDGYPYQPMLYVKNHVFSRQQNSDQVHLQRVCLYVSKYITKDSSFVKVVDSRLLQYFRSRFVKYCNPDVDWNDITFDDIFSFDQGEKDLYKKLRKEMMQFHRQSHGFGEDFLKYNNYDDIFKTGMISMPDSNNIVKHIQIPSYYQYKIWYELVKNENGKAVRWELNDEGKKYKLSHLVQSVDRMAIKIEDWLVNMKNYNYYHDSEDREWYDKIINEFEKLNEGRDLKEFTAYLLFYKGKVMDPVWYKTHQMTDPVTFWMIDKDPVLQYEFQLKAGEMFGMTEVYGYNHASYRKFFGQKFVNYSDLGTIIDWKEDGIPSHLAQWVTYSNIFKQLHGFMPSISKSQCKTLISEFSLRSWIIDDTVNDSFRNYDRMFSLYCEAQRDKNDLKQRAFDSKEEIKKKFKDFNQSRNI